MTFILSSPKNLEGHFISMDLFKPAPISAPVKITGEEVAKLSVSVYRGEFEPATLSLIDVLYRAGNLGLRSVDSIGASEKVMTELASAVTAMFASPKFQLNENGFRSLISVKWGLRRVFLSSSFFNLNHIFAYLGEIVDGVARVKPEFFPKLMLAATLDNMPSSIFPILESMTDEAQMLIWLSFLDTSCVVTPIEQANLDRLIQLRDKIKDTPLKSNLEIACAARVWFHCTFWDNRDKHKVKQKINRAFYHRAKSLGYVDQGVLMSAERKTSKPTIVVIFEVYTRSHAMYRCFAGPLEKLAELCKVYAMGPEEKISTDVLGWAEDVVYFDSSRDVVLDMEKIKKIRPDIIYYPSLGMDPYAIQLAQLRLAPIQMMSGGHPASSSGAKIDYFIIEEGFVPKNFEDISEKVVVTDKKTMAVFARPRKEPAPPEQKKTKVGGSVDLVCNSMYYKLTPSFIDACHQIEAKTKERVCFHFLTGCDDLSERAVRPALEEKISNFLFYKKLDYLRYTQVMASCDIQLTPFPFGNANSFVDAMLVGLPTIAMAGQEICSVNEPALSQMMDLPKFCLADSFAEYIGAAIRLIEDSRERQAIAEKIRSVNLDSVLFSPPLSSARDFPNTIKFIYENHQDLSRSSEKVFYP